ncbi:hypothetical protein ABIE67_006410 [Streptomyces sp. V4I8]
MRWVFTVASLMKSSRVERGSSPGVLGVRTAETRREATAGERTVRPSAAARTAVKSSSRLEPGAQDVGDPAVVGDGIEAGHPDAAGVGDAQPLDTLHGGGLAGAVRTEDPEDLALLHGEGDSVDDGPAAVRLAQIGDFDDGHGIRVAAGRGAAHRPSRSKAHRPIG